MEIKEYAQIIENELAQKIGFVIPKENIIVSNHQKNWTYLPESRSIIAPDILQTNDNKAEIDFSVAHEFAHMIQNFIFSSKIKLENITKEKYEKEINAFFGVDNIKITEQQFNDFKGFLQENLLGNKDFVKIMKFDDAHYVSLQDSYENSLMGSLSCLYYNNSTEIHANIFATEMIVEKYKEEKQSNKLMQQLLEKINKHFQYIDIDDVRSKELFKRQVEISKENSNTLKGFVKQKIKDTIQIPTRYSSYDFKLENNLLSNQIEKISSIQKDIEENYKTSEQIKQLENEKTECLNKIQELSQQYPKSIKIINNFVPLADDAVHLGPLIRQYSNYIDMKNSIEQFLQPGIKEFIIDMNSIKIYPYYFNRTIEMTEANTVLSGNEPVNLTTNRDEVNIEK